MARVSCWLLLPIVIYIGWQKYQCNKLEEKMLEFRRQNFQREAPFREQTSFWKRENVVLAQRINEAVAANRHLTNQLNEFKMKLEESDLVSSDLKRQLRKQEEVLKSNEDKQKQLQTTNDDLTKTVESLNQRLQALCEPPKFACRSLLVAAKSGDVNSTKQLVKCSSDSSSGNCVSTDGFRFTPLTYAARNGHVEVVRVLLEAGSNLEISSASGWTALHQAARQEHLDMCRLLLDWGANVNSLNDGRDTPLHLAARHGHLSVAKLFVESGADFRLKNDIGQTALHDAARRGHLSVVKLLVERGADVRLKNDKGQTARDVARWEEKMEVAEWLDSVIV